MDATTFQDLAMALAFWLWAIWPAIGIWMIWAWALQAIWRNPSASSDIKSTMILAIAFAEALWIFAFVIAMMIKFI